VIDPSHETFAAMLSKFGELKSGDGGDQARNNQTDQSSNPPNQRNARQRQRHDRTSKQKNKPNRSKDESTNPLRRKQHTAKACTLKLR
jgi:hypothetical protein